MSATRLIVLALAILLILPLTGCASSYVTPGAAVNLADISSPQIRRQFELKPASPFPARLAVAQVQGTGYVSHRQYSYGTGNYSVVTVRDKETETQLATLQNLGLVAGIAPMNRMVIPPVLKTDEDIRSAAAAVRADMLLLYTLDTQFRVNDHDIGPLGIITLGFSPNQTASVTTTASAMIMDVRTGFIYGLAEASAKRSQLANVWSSDDAVDDCRVKTEAQALENLMPEVQTLWNGVLAEYAATSAKAK